MKLKNILQIPKLNKEKKEIQTQNDWTHSFKNKNNKIAVILTFHFYYFVTQKQKIKKKN